MQLILGDKGHSCPEGDFIIDLKESKFHAIAEDNTCCEATFYVIFQEFFLTRTLTLGAGSFYQRRAAGRFSHNKCIEL